MTASELLDPRLAPEAAQLIAQQRSLNLQPRHLAGVAEARRRVRRSPKGPRSDEQVTVVDRQVVGAGGLRPARLYRPRGTVEVATMLYLHGGGWALGDLEINDHVCRAVASQVGVAILSLDYRLAPEHPFPAALEDAQCALEELARGLPPTGGDEPLDPPLRPTLAVAGLSAGGNLAAALARRSRDALCPRLDAHLLFCPVLDHDFARASYEEYGQGLNLTRDDMMWFWDMYLDDEVARDQPDASPLRAQTLAGLCPAVVLISGADVLRDEAVAYCERLRADGVQAFSVIVEGIPHGMIMNPDIPSAQAESAAALQQFRCLLSREGG